MGAATAIGRQRGNALLTVLLILTLLLPLVAHSVFQARLDLLLARNLREGTDAFYVAEATLEEALRRLAVGEDAELTRTNRLGWHEGDFGGRGSLRLPQGRVGVFQWRVVDAERVEVVAEASGARGGQRRLAAMLARSPVPYTPAALVLAGATRSVDWDTNRFRIVGDTATPAAAEPLVFLDDARESTTGLGLEALRARLPGLEPARIVVGGVAPATFGSLAEPALSLVEGDLEVTAECVGAGLLWIEGSLRVRHRLRFDGLVVVRAGLDIDPGAELVVSGSLWQGSAILSPRLQGEGRIAYDPGGLRLAERSAPGFLPHRWTVTGRYEPG